MEGTKPLILCFKKKLKLGFQNETSIESNQNLEILKIAFQFENCHKKTKFSI